MEVIKQVTLTKSQTADESNPNQQESEQEESGDESESEEETDCDVIPPTVKQNVPSGNDSGEVRSGLQKQQKDAIQLVYKRYIESGEKIPLKTVRTMMSTNFVLRKLACHADQVKKVVNHIAYLQKCQPRQEPQDMLLDPIKPATWPTPTTMIARQ